MKVAILATDGFEQSELLEPKKALEEAGYQTDIISIKEGKIKGWSDGKWGKRLDVTATAGQAKAKDYAALVIPGGVMNPDKLRMDKNVLKLVKDFNKNNLPIAAICHAGWVLIDSGIAKGKKLTSYKSIKPDMVNAGANWVDKKVVIDGNLITSRNPDDLPAFNQAILNALK